MEADEVDELVARCRAGDGRAFDELVLTLQGQLRLAIAARASSAELVDEVLQATFVTAYQRLADYRPEHRFLPWLKGIARNRLREELRARARGLVLDAGALERIAADEALRELEEEDDDDERLDRLQARLRRCLERLRPDGRRLLEARYGDGRTLPDLARRFSRRATALASQIKRLRTTVRHCMRQEAS